jgi:SAM-dependent methyltransferase
MARLTPAELERLDPYTLMAVLGKKVIRPGGARATETLFRMAGLGAGDTVLDIGCGVGTTAIQLVSRFDCRVTGVDLDELMIEYARQNIRRAGLADKITLRQGDIQALPFADATFDVVSIEAVTMFTAHQQRSVQEAVRVCQPGGRIFDHEFVWVREPPGELRHVFDNLVCPGMSFGTQREWRELYQEAGQEQIRTVAVPFDLLTFRGMIRDEGVAGTIAFIARSMSRWSYLKKMLWLSRQILRVSPYLGSVVIASTKAPRRTRENGYPGDGR